MKRLTKTQKKTLVIGLSVFLILIGIVAFAGFNRTFSVGSAGITKLAIPHFASYKCEPIQDKFGIKITIPLDGALISKSTVGFYTNGISNIKSTVDYGFFTSLIKDVRIRYQICDVNGNNCGSDNFVTYVAPGTRIFTYDSLDLTRESMRSFFEKRTIASLLQWVPDGSGSASMSYDGKVFGLTLSSTTQDPAGAKICTTSCRLDCPDIGYRQDLVLDCNGNTECLAKGTTGKNILGFYDTAPYFEYWEDINYDLNVQGGANVYNPSTNKFCFAGKVYTGKTLTLGSGSYIYPDTNTRQTLSCCPGAVISSTNSDQICQSNGEWKTIQDSDKLTCLSDINCPNAGNSICQDRQLSSGYYCTNKDSNGIGICKKFTSTTVECCTANDCNRDMVCDTSFHTCKGGVSLPTCGNKLVETGEQCDDGNTIGGDGCSSICQSEEVCTKDDECESGFKCSEGRCVRSNYCESCDAFAKSNLLGLIFPSQKCEKKFLQNNLTCALSYVKLISVLLVLIASLLVGKDLLSSFSALENKEWLAWIIASIIAVSLAVLTYFIFIAGVIVAGIVILARVLIKMFLKR